MAIPPILGIRIRDRVLIIERTIPHVAADTERIFVQNAECPAFYVVGLVDHAPVLVDAAYGLRGRCGLPVAGVEDYEVSIAFEGSRAEFEEFWGYGGGREDGVGGY
jgi:hypothetical protein